MSNDASGRERPANAREGLHAPPQPDRPVSPGVRAALALIRGYQLLISPMFAGSCRFLPSCADYAREAIEVHGVLVGSWFTIRRLARCHPLCRGGHDPVPPRLAQKLIADNCR
jgi:putative membrane protein insertion efficiency factor